MDKTSVNGDLKQPFFFSRKRSTSVNMELVIGLRLHAYS